MIRKMVIAMTFAVLGTAMAFAPVAAADKPTKEPVPFADVSGQFCENFPVLIHATKNQEFIRTFSSGRALITGAFKVEVTNLETGKTIALNASGPVAFSSDGTTVTLKGSTLLFGEAGFFGPGSPPQLSSNSGTVVIDLSNGSILSQRGHSEDLCAQLAHP